MDIKQVIELIRNYPVPRADTADRDYSEGYLAGYNNALDDLVRSLESQTETAE